VVWRYLGAVLVVAVVWGKVDLARVDLHEDDKHVLSVLVAVLGTRSEPRAEPDTAANRTD